ncbi:DNA translocase FtsK 4TM domain-containing protein [Acidiphilium sp. AL]|uniref:DNA translocase FtsK n=1 Tax=Acidiphilium iwatense TaxID=768198 RepID=A0ABS9DSH4_9PROT|nr:MULTISPECIES: DNA translocase FtsK [Acidiphilium]MCF3945675.1 DNA translocase FtsK 4TM domain-containing protein [Acidiphilium iwatense]MCU4159522.1 DNA translocase FtsK 4TM domain-containing protein [Acidiphilium sp. AL]
MSATTDARRFLSPALKARFARHFAEIAALFAVLAGLTVLIALATYHPGDPSFDTASTLPPANLAGRFGAGLADALLQGFGVAAVLPGLVLLAWAYGLVNRGGIGHWRMRLAATLVAMPALAAALGAAHAIDPRLMPDWPVPAGLGGAAGALLGGFGASVAHSALGVIGRGLALASSALIGLASTLYAFGLSPGEWRAAGRGAAKAARISARQSGRAMRGARSGAGAVSAWLAPVLNTPPMTEALDPEERAALLVPLHDRPGHERLGHERLVAAPTKLTRAAPAKKAPPKQERLPLPETGWRLPPMELLKPAPQRATTGPSAEALQSNARLLETVLGDYGVQGRIVEIRPGPVVTLYELEPAPGIRSARVIGLADDIARSLSVLAVRIATVQGRNVIGIEVPNAKRETVFLSELMEVAEWGGHSGKLALALGKDIGGVPVIADLARMPHLLIAGTTGSGKSVGVNAMILSLLYRLSPEQCRLILIDPKMLELSVYEGIPHLLAPVVTEPAKAVAALKWVVREMERRYRAMSGLSVRNIAGYNDRVNEALSRGEVVTRRVQTGFDSETGRPIFEDQPLALEALPLIVVVIDEMADLMMVAGKEIEAAVQRLAQMARAAGIHVIMATQRPSVDVITGTIKANFPTRISFQVISKFDSRTILGEQGSEQLLGQGDMLYMAGGGRITRVHGPFVTDREVEDVVAYLREQGEPDYVEAVTEAIEEDAPVMPGLAAAEAGEGGLYQQAVSLVAREGKASTSFIQRHLQIGYNRAARLIEQMEKEGVVGPANHVGKREVLITGGRDD